MDYNLIQKQISELIALENNYVSVMANLSALLYENLPKLNWAGFYLVKGDHLVLGPFQGKVACVLIPYGKGVCGSAWALNKPLVVDNVHEFPGHIACDSASNSEVVIPISQNGEIKAVLDLDSYEYARFTQADLAGLESLAERVAALIKF